MELRYFSQCEVLQKEELNIIEAMTLIGSALPNLRVMNNKREAVSNSINKSLNFAECLRENPREEFSLKRTTKFPLSYDQHAPTLRYIDCSTGG